MVSEHIDVVYRPKKNNLPYKTNTITENLFKAFL